MFLSYLLLLNSWFDNLNSFCQITCASESQKEYRLCGVGRPPRIHFSCSKIKIVFKTDRWTPGSGFILEVDIHSTPGEIFTYIYVIRFQH